MKNEDFEKSDSAWMEALRTEREKKVPWDILHGFAVSVQKRIIAKQNRPVWSIPPARVWAPVLVPTFAVLVIASVVVLRLPGQPAVLTPAPAPVQLASAANLADVDDEIAALKELGVWTDEDDQALGLADDGELEDIELSDQSNGLEKQLA